MTNSIVPPWSSTAPGSAKGDKFHAFTFIGAAVSAVTTFATISMALPAWAMFLGWVGFSVSGATTREGVANTVSFLLGLTLGVGTSLAIAFLTPLLGPVATPLAIFGDVMIVLSLRAVPPINNPLAYFLGLISFFASERAPSGSTLAVLAAAGVIGALGARLSSFLQSRMLHAA